MSNNRFGSRNIPGLPMGDPTLAKMAQQHQEAMKKALEDNAEVFLAKCEKCDVTDLTIVTLAEVYIVKVPAMPTEGIEEQGEMIPRPRILQFYCPACGDLVAQKTLHQSANPKVVNRDQVDTKEITTEDGKKIIVPDIDKDLQETLPIEEEKEEEPPSSTT